MIPKTIHYCWFGGKPKPKLAKKCIASWRKFCPDYEIIEWNEQNYDVHKNEYTSFCYDRQKWAYLSDFVRLDVVAEHGGIYFDTDVELIRPLDELLSHEAFFGLEARDTVATGLGFGSIKNHAVIEAMKQPYLNGSLKINGAIVPKGCPKLNTEALLSFGFTPNGERQNLAGAEILPPDYMNPLESATGRLRRTENTVSIHWYGMSAQSTAQRMRAHLTRPLHRWFGNDCFAWVKK